MNDYKLWMAAIFVALTVLDTVLTAYGIRRGAVEANPVLKFAMRVMGPFWVLLKAAAIAYVVLKYENMALNALILINMGMLVVVIHNVRVVGNL